MKGNAGPTVAARHVCFVRHKNPVVFRKVKYVDTLISGDRWVCAVIDENGFKSNGNWSLRNVESFFGITIKEEIQSIGIST